MTLFLNGGGADEQVKEAYLFLKEKVDTNKPLLYVPLAMEKEKYPSCLDWITKEMSDYRFSKIDMVTSVEELATKEFNKYGAIFIGGGDTYKLLADLKSCSAYEKIQNFLATGGTAFGGSAGAIIFGKNLDSCSHEDKNTVGLQDTSGFNQVFGAYIGAHYKNGNPEREKNATEAFIKLSFEGPIVALPEEDTLVIDKNEVRVIGSRNFYIFKNGVQYTYKPKIYSVNDFKKELASPIKANSLQMKKSHHKEIY